MSAAGALSPDERQEAMAAFAAVHELASLSWRAAFAPDARRSHVLADAGDISARIEQLKDFFRKSGITDDLEEL